MQVNSEFQAFKHVEILGPGEHMRAQQPLEATLAIHPTVVLTNALPYPMHLILWQVRSLLLRVKGLPWGVWPFDSNNLDSTLWQVNNSPTSH